MTRIIKKHKDMDQLIDEIKDIESAKKVLKLIVKLMEKK